MELVVSESSGRTCLCPSQKCPYKQLQMVFGEISHHHPAPWQDQEAIRVAAAKRATMPLASCLSDQRCHQPHVVNENCLPPLSVGLSVIYLLLGSQRHSGGDEQRFTGVTLSITSLRDPGFQEHSSHRFCKLVLEKGTMMENLLATTSLAVIISRHIGLIMKVSSTQWCWPRDTSTVAAKSVSRSLRPKMVPHM